MMARPLTSAEAVLILAEQGLHPIDDGFTSSHLAAYAAHQGWTVSIEQTSSPLPRRRWRASVTARLLPHGYLMGTLGSGATEEEALVIAVAGMVRQRARGG
jgi:hypothetical protein